jgi:hypothetical protein
MLVLCGSSELQLDLNFRRPLTKLDELEANRVNKDVSLRLVP